MALPNRTGAALTAAALALLVVPPAQAAPVDRTIGGTTVTATVDHWADGDTVVTDLGSVRLIGINAPDLHECGYAKATGLAEALAPAGSTVTLTLPAAHEEHDAYGRLLRYVAAGGTDIGLRQLKAGSQAKYDSTDGYGAHPKQAKYRKQDIRHRDYCGSRDLRSYTPVSRSACPRKAPIKGNRGDTWIYHLPSNKYYAVTDPEECFASADGAKKAGYRASLI